MCLIAFAWRAHPDYELVLAANRDEFHERPTAAAAFWRDAPDICGGRDLKQGGSWLALRRNRRLAAVTNVRRMQPPDPQAPSRGALVADFVRGEGSAAGWLDALAAKAARYAGFNLLAWDGEALHYASNHPDYARQAVTPGLHVVSNASLDTPWPKALRLRTALELWLARADKQTETPRLEHLFKALADREPAADDNLPDTGVGLEMERYLSPPFICGPRYGTRASTLVLIRSDGHIHFVERRFGADGTMLGEQRTQI